MPGAQDIVLSDVLKALGIGYHVDEVQAKTSNGTAEDDIIASVTSTNDNIISVEQVNGEWIARVLKDGNAYLTIVLKDASITLMLYQVKGNDETAFAAVTLNGVAEDETAMAATEKDAAKESWTAVGNSKNAFEITPWQAWFRDLPKYAPDGTEYGYKVRETTGATGYVVTYGDGTNNSVVLGDTNTNVTNTEQKDFTFTKKWTLNNGTEAQAWAEGKTIEVTIGRRNKNTPTEVDSNFEVVYSINASSTEITPQTVKPETLTAADLKLTRTDENNVHTFALGKVLEPKTGTTEWEYFVKETSIDGVIIRYTDNGAVKDGLQQATSGEGIINDVSSVQLPQTGGIGTTLFSAIGAALSGTAGAALTLKKRKEKE